MNFLSCFRFTLEWFPLYFRSLSQKSSHFGLGFCWGPRCLLTKGGCIEASVWFGSSGSV